MRDAGSHWTLYGALCAVAIGAVAAVIGSIVVAVLVNMTAGYVRSPWENLPWLVGVSAVPAAAAMTFLYALDAKGRLRAWTTARVSVVVAFGVLLLVGMVAIPIDHALRFGWSWHGFPSRAAWSLAYAVLLLPMGASLIAGGLSILRKVVP